MTLTADALKKLSTDLLAAAGVLATNAEAAADVFTRATLRGMGHHDISYLPQRLDWLAKGKVNGKAEPLLLFDSGALRVWDGAGGLGEAVCRHLAVDAMESAEKFGVGFSTARRSNHFLAASPYVEMISQRGMIGLVWSNTDPCMSGPGGKSLVIGNNPMGFGAPGETTDINLDMCMAYASLGTLKALGECAIPNYWGKDSEGKPAETAGGILNGGVGHPIGGHKGFSLAVMHEMLTAGVSGGDWGASAKPLSGGLGTHSQTVLAIRPPFGTKDFAARNKKLGNILTARDSGVRLPGQSSGKKSASAAKEGVILSEAVIRSLREWCDRLGVVWVGS